MLVRDIEAGVADTILSYPWDGIFTFTHWFYKEDDPLMHNARTVIELLSDIVSKNGNMLLNVELKADGTIAPEHKRFWMKWGSGSGSIQRQFMEADPGRFTVITSIPVYGMLSGT